MYSTIRMASDKDAQSSLSHGKRGQWTNERMNECVR